MSGRLSSLSGRAPRPVGDTSSGVLPGHPARINILGVEVSVLDMPTAIHVIDGWIERRAFNYVCVTSVHGLVESQGDEKLRQIHNHAGLVTPDGMPLVWTSRLRRFPQAQRVCGAELMAEVCRESVSKGYRHFLYGGAAGVPERLSDQLRERFPGIRIVGTYSPPFRPLTPKEDAEVVRRINESRADVVWIGLSTPKQEYWMAAHLERLDAPVMLGVGAAFDFLAGFKQRPPRWIRQGGLEWLYRLITEPRRLWRRYLTIVPLFVFYMVIETLGVRSRQDDVTNPN